MEEQMLEHLKRAAEAMEAMVAKMEQQGEQLVAKVEAMGGELKERIAKISAVADASEVRASGGGARKTVVPFIAKILAEAEGDAKKLEQALRPLSIEQRIAVKMAAAQNSH